MRKLLVSLVAALLLTVTGVPHAQADEGMWTYDNFPSALVQQKYGVKIDQAWLDKVRLATVRLSGCTASFISPDGLILTNHHCSAQCLAEISDAQHDTLRDGFLAQQRGEEKSCPSQLADVLVGMEDISSKIVAAIKGKDDKAANDARKKTLTQLESACEQAAGKKNPLKCQSVQLYQGGQYFLYKYKRYNDVRLVFAPEQAIAAFGGDPDNFQFPRWCLDMSVLRAYEDGKPVKTANFLKVNWQGPAEKEPVFVTGHPGSTDRLLTVAQLKQLRDLDLPTWLLRASELRGRYIQYGKTGAEPLRVISDPLNGLENSIKVRRKQLDALHDDAMLTEKIKQEKQLRDRIAGDTSTAATTGDPWGEIEKALAVERGIAMPYTFIEAGAGFNSQLYRYAKALVRSATERAKPNDERLREFTDGALPLLQRQLTTQVPVYPDREVLTLSFGFERMREWLGPDHPMVRALLKTESPDGLAARLLRDTKLADPAVRRQLWEGGAAAIAASGDPLIKLALQVDPEARALRKRYEDEVEAPVDSASEKIAAWRYTVYGTSVYPDATFTLRLNFGTVQGWNESGTPVPAFTQLATAFERSTGADPFRMPESWLKVKSQLDMTTPFNFSTNNDIVGGNSGSPLINAQGEIVGLMFDGNIHSISGSYWFDTAKNRAVAVHPRIIREALTKVYSASTLSKELGL
ncbi:MAG: S46 family peptidase [Steroidobacteraceae bacterium]